MITDGFVQKYADDRDGVLWTSLMYAVTDEVRHREALAACLDSNGEPFRTPEKRAERNQFSRDMVVGFIVAASRSPEGARLLRKLTEYIRRTGFIFPRELSSDTRHLMTPTLWLVIGRVVPSAAPWYWRWLAKSDRLMFHLMRISIEMAPRGYQQHLNACLLLALIGKLPMQMSSLLGTILYSTDMRNPFFTAMAGSPESAGIMLARCRDELNAAPNKSNSTQWCWERASNEKAHLGSCGHDFDFLEKLLGRIPYGC